jgi:hypothetical protein
MVRRNGRENLIICEHVRWHRCREVCWWVSGERWAVKMCRSWRTCYLISIDEKDSGQVCGSMTMYITVISRGSKLMLRMNENNDFSGWFTL